MEHKAFEISTAFDDRFTVAGPDIVPSRRDAPTGEDHRGALRLVPERVVQPLSRPTSREIAVMVAAALLVHGGFAALMVLLLSWRDLPPPPEEAIPVEIVSAIPEMPKPAPLPPPPPPEPLPEPPPPEPPAPPVAEASPPLHLAAPPPEPMPGATPPMLAKTVEPVLAPLPEKHTEAAAPPAEAPLVLATPQGSFAVPPPAPAPPSAPDSSRAAPRPAATVNMADILPMDVSALPSTFRTILSSESPKSGAGGENDGGEIDAEYKGLVHGRIIRSHHASEEARSRQLKGQVGVAFKVDDQGHVVDLRVTISSGKPALDAIGLDMVREAEPFPPPPPGAIRTFAKVFFFGGP